MSKSSRLHINTPPPILKGIENGKILLKQLQPVIFDGTLRSFALPELEGKMFYDFDMPEILSASGRPFSTHTYNFKSGTNDLRKVYQTYESIVGINTYRMYFSDNESFNLWGGNLNSFLCGSDARIEIQQSIPDVSNNFVLKMKFYYYEV